MNELEKTVTDLGHIQAKARFDSDKFLNDLNKLLKRMYEAMGYQIFKQLH